MRRSCWRIHLAILALAAALPGTAAAQQQQSTIQALAVLEEALGGYAARDLEFGTLTPGVSQTVAPQDAQSCAGCVSGLWVFPSLSPANAASRRYVRVTFVALPSTLAGPGGATLPLNWTNASRGCVMRGATALHCTTGTPVNGGAYSYPVNGPTAPAAAQPGTNGRSLNVYLGGTAVPSAAQRAGVYNGSITLRFEYSSF